MTDARIPERWLTDRRILRLDAESYRAFFMSLTWAVSNRTDGVIEPEDLALIPHFAEGSARALVKAGLWTVRECGWHICDYATTQTTREQLDQLFAARARERERKARQRAAKRAGGTDVPGDVPGDVPPDCTGKARQGKDRQGQEEQPDDENEPGHNGAHHGCACGRLGPVDPGTGRCEWCEVKQRRAEAAARGEPA